MPEGFYGEMGFNIKPQNNYSPQGISRWNGIKQSPAVLGDLVSIEGKQGLGLRCNGADSLQRAELGQGMLFLAGLTLSLWKWSCSPLNFLVPRWLPLAKGFFQGAGMCQAGRRSNLPSRQGLMLQVCFVS